MLNFANRGLCVTGMRVFVKMQILWNYRNYQNDYRAVSMYKGVLTCR